MTSENPPTVRPELDDAPPVLGRWRNIYLLVMINLFVMIAIFSVITAVLS